MIDILHLEEYRENNRIEAKLARGGFPGSFWETYSSFANTMGGVILLGMEERKDTSLHAVDLPHREQLVRTFWETVKDKTKVSACILTPKDVSEPEYEGKRIIVVTVPRADRFDKPVYIGSDPYTGSYRRNGEGDYRCPREEVDAMLRDAKSRSADMAALKHRGLSDLDFASVKDYRLRISVMTDNAMPDLSDCGFLKKTGAAVRGKDNRLHPTQAGLLAFGKYAAIRREFSHFSLVYRDATAPQNNLSAGKEACGNVYEFYYAVCARMEEYSQGTLMFGGLCEGLLNCLINADYRAEGGVTVERDRGFVRFVNAGSFRTNLSAAAKGGVSDPRNAGLKRIFTRLGQGEGKGSGLPSVYSVWRKRGWDMPELTESFHPDRTELKLSLGKSNAPTKDVKAPNDGALRAALIVQYLTENRQATEEELCAALSLSAKNAKKSLERMVGQGFVSVSDGIYKLKR